MPGAYPMVAMDMRSEAARSGFIVDQRSLSATATKKSVEQILGCGATSVPDQICGALSGADSVSSGVQHIPTSRTVPASETFTTPAFSEETSGLQQVPSTNVPPQVASIEIVVSPDIAQLGHAFIESYVEDAYAAYRGTLYPETGAFLQELDVSPEAEARRREAWMVGNFNRHGDEALRRLNQALPPDLLATSSASTGAVAGA